MNRGNCPDSVARLTRFSVSGTLHSAASATHRAGDAPGWASIVGRSRQVREAIDAQETRGSASHHSDEVGSVPDSRTGRALGAVQ